jgi:ribokinase
LLALPVSTNFALTVPNQLSERLATEQVVPRLIQIPNTASDSSIIIKDGTGKNVIVTTVDCARSLKVSDVEQKMTDAASGDLLVLQGNLELAITKQIIATARKRGMKIVLNTSPFENGIELLLADLDTLFVKKTRPIRSPGAKDLLRFKNCWSLGSRPSSYRWVKKAPSLEPRLKF